MPTHYTLVRTDTGQVLSRHRLLSRADAAACKLDRAVQRSSGRSAYVPTAILQSDHRLTGRYVQDHSEWPRPDFHALCEAQNQAFREA